MYIHNCIYCIYIYTFIFWKLNHLQSSNSTQSHRIPHLTSVAFFELRFDHTEMPGIHETVREADYPFMIGRLMMCLNMFKHIQVTTYIHKHWMWENLIIFPPQKKSVLPTLKCWTVTHHHCNSLLVANSGWKMLAKTERRGWTLSPQRTGWQQDWWIDGWIGTGNSQSLWLEGGGLMALTSPGKSGVVAAEVYWSLSFVLVPTHGR